MKRPVIAILTDFGTADHYVASMKGVALGICPSATLVDISHDVPPQDVLAGALILESCWRDFPLGTVFLAVVDPGVGTSRRALAAEAGGRLLVGPDNGLLSLAFEQATTRRVVEIAAARFQRVAQGRTFEGRDRFAPVAAHLARGVALGAIGPAAGETARVIMPAVRVALTRLGAEVIAVDRYGNLLTNLHGDLLARWAGAGAVTVTLGRRRIGGLVGTYAEAAPGAACALIGSSGRLEIAVRGGDAARECGAGRGTRVVVSTRNRAERP